MPAAPPIKKRRPKQRRLELFKPAEPEAQKTNPDAGPSPIDLRADAFLRPPDWRWRRADYFHRIGKKPSLADDDVETWDAYKLQRELAARKTDEARLPLVEACPNWFAAFQLCEQAEPHQRWEIEARILAREPFDAIGKKCGLSARAVRTYESWYFNVTDRLETPSWIVHRAIGPIHSTRASDDLGILWRHLGYFGGSHLLDAVLHDRPTASRPNSPAEVKPFIKQVIFETLERKALIAVRSLPLNDPQTGLAVVKLWLRLQELQARRAERLRQYSDVAGAVDGCSEEFRRILNSENPLHRLCRERYGQDAGCTEPQPSSPVSVDPIRARYGSIDWTTAYLMGLPDEIVARLRDACTGG